jgi:hypothetical protein
MAITGVLDSYGVAVGASPRNCQAKAAIQVCDLYDVAIDDRKAPEAGWVLVARELDDFAVVVPPAPAGLRHRPLCAFMMASLPPGGRTAAAARVFILRATNIAIIEQDAIDLTEPVGPGNAQALMPASRVAVRVGHD